MVTTRGEQHAYGMTANAFSSVSLDPPLVLVCVISPSEGATHITSNGVFALKQSHLAAPKRYNHVTREFEVELSIPLNGPTSGCRCMSARLPDSMPYTYE